MYHVTGIGVTAAVLYILSTWFYRTGFYSRQLHRKIWNILLAVTFVSTVLAGLFLALHVSYKWNIPFVKTILRWHVEFGAGLAFTGIIHLLWHYSYFFDLSGKKGSSTPIIPESFSTGIGTNLFIVGFASTSIQLLLLREMLNLSGGYELISGIFLGSWLISSAAGSALAAGSELHDLKKINYSFSVSPLVSILLLILLPRLMLGKGQTPSILFSVVLSLVVLVPFCLISGFTFVRLTGIAVKRGVMPGKSFGTETAGGIAAGAIVTILTSGIMNTYQLLLLIIILLNTWTALNFGQLTRKQGLIVRAAALIAASVVIILNADIFFRQLLMPGVRVRNTIDTPYGNITLGERDGEKSLYYDQRLVSFSGDATVREEDVHYAMLQHDDPEDVILISGSLKALLPELLKYPVRKITYIERDPAIALSEGAIAETGAVVTVESDDAFTYMRSRSDSADVILMLVPPPSNLLLNRFYTVEFFEEAARKLGEDGVFVCSPGPADSYPGKEASRLYSSVFNSLKKVFDHVIPIAGNKLYFLASRKPLSTEICRLVAERKVTSLYVSADYLADDLIAMRSREVMSFTDRDIKPNTSSYPIAYRSVLGYNLEKGKGEKTSITILMIILFAAPAFMVRRKNLIMFFSASALAGFEIVLLLSLQLVIGNMYQLTGLIMAALMAGLAAGASLTSVGRIPFSVRITLLIMIYALTGLFFEFITYPANPAALLLLITLAFLPGCLTGSVFSELTSRGSAASVAAIYSADLAGSAAGFIIISALAVPFLGIRLSIFLISLLVCAGLLAGMNKQ